MLHSLPIPPSFIFSHQWQMTTVLITQILITYVSNFHQNRVNSPPVSSDILMNRHSKPRVQAIQNKTPKNLSVNTVTRLQTARPEFDYGKGQNYAVFFAASGPPLRPNQPSIHWIGDSFPEGKAAVREVDYSPPFTSQLKKCVELQFHSRLRPHKICFITS